MYKIMRKMNRELVFIICSTDMSAYVLLRCPTEHN